MAYGRTQSQLRNQMMHFFVGYQRNGLPSPIAALCNEAQFQQKQTYMALGDVASWTSMISSHVHHGQIEDARQLFDKLPERNVVSWTAMIAGYAQHERMEDARELFEKTPERNVISWNAMIAGYSKGRRLDHARQLFEKMPERNVVSWTAMITGYAQNQRLGDARKMFDRMPEQNTISWNAMIAGYVQNGRMETARQLFDKMPERNVASWNALITGYVQNGRIREAGKLFDLMSERNLVSWTAMISGCSQNGHSEEALMLFCQMQQAGIQPNQSTFASALSASASLVAWEPGCQIHAQTIQRGFESSVFVVSALINMYAKCSDIVRAGQLFDQMSERNIVLWTAMIAAYAHNGLIKNAQEIFEKMPERNVVSWTAMIAGYGQNGLVDEALKLFSEMQRDGIKPNEATFTNVIGACATQATQESGQQVHSLTIKSGFESDAFVRSALIAMYAKCGGIDESCRVFDKICEHDVASWNAMIAACAQHGQSKEALQLFDQMQCIGLRPNHITFVGVLTACSHGGLVDKGWHLFYSMSQDHGLTPRMDHYGCMVDLLGRAGRLEEADDFIKKMPFEPDVVVWGALLGACRIHVNRELGERAAEHLLELEPQNAATYVVLSRIYAAAGRWNDAAELSIARKDKGIKKNPGCSWIVLAKTVHTFLTGDRSHPQTGEIYALLDGLSGQMEKVGYRPNIDLVLHDVEEELKEPFLPFHSEKLAIAFGLISTSPGMPIRIIKNLRVCNDCHTSIKFISMIVGREIVARDSSRFHHFKDGLCSCNDYW